MEINVLSIRQAKENLRDVDTKDIKMIVASSYDCSIDSIANENKLILHFDDITTLNKNSINSNIAKQINSFVRDIDFNKQILYVCCDSGVSRSSAIAAAILRKYNENEDIIWKDYRFKPNILVYKTVCDEFNLKNFPIRLKHKENINKKAFKKKIKESRKCK